MRTTALLMLGVAATSGAIAAETAADCEAIYQTVTNSVAFPTPESKVAHLRDHGRGCKGTGIYESRLAYFLVETGNLEQARQILGEGLATPNSYHKELGYSLADLDVAAGQLDVALRNATKLKDAYPDWFGGYVLMAKITLMQREFAQSVRHGLEANRRSPNASTFLGLAIAYHQLDQDEQAVAAGFEAMALDPTVVAKGAGINETIYSLVRLNRYEGAAALAKKRIANDPAWRADPVFMKAYEHLRRKMPGEFAASLEQ